MEKKQLLRRRLKRYLNCSVCEKFKNAHKSFLSPFMYLPILTHLFFAFGVFEWKVALFEQGSDNRMKDTLRFLNFEC